MPEQNFQNLMPEPLNSPPRIFILAGEASGDKIGADLIAGLNQVTKINLSGVGGKDMQKQGLNSLFPITDLSVMGIVDVAARLPLLLWRVRQTINFIIKTNPQIVVLIDSQVFSNLVAKGLRKKGRKSPILLYVGPTVWVYKPQRAEKIKPLYDEVLAILPFEPAAMKSLNGPKCSYVGHPAVKTPTNKTSPSNSNTLVLMPGSRDGELRRHLPMFGKTAEQLIHSNPELDFVIITLPHLEKKIVSATANWSVPVKIVTGSDQRKKYLNKACLAICVSGTVTIELAMAQVPMVVTYVMDTAQNTVNKSLQVKRFSLPNLILEQDLVPELLMERPQTDLLTKEVKNLLENPQNLREQFDGFSQVLEKMQSGTHQFPRQNPVEVILSHIKPEK
ncbi:MAG: lipid-A-disaccharide synthase [Devosiaceae bacterium]|nr:lipid-A-disaccharide synthase [Devosiaceae bacterium]